MEGLLYLIIGGICTYILATKTHKVLDYIDKQIEEKHKDLFKEDEEEN